MTVVYHSMGKTQTYDELLLPNDREPASVLQSLIESKQFAQYGIYQGEDEVCFAGGAAMAVTVDREQVSLVGLGCDRAVTARNPLKQVESLLAEIPIEDWTAYGYVSFDLVRYYYSYGKAIAAPLLYFFVPMTEAIITLSEIRVRTLDNVETIRNLVLRSQPQPTPKPASISFPETFGDEDIYHHRVETLQKAIRDGQLHKAIMSRSVKVKGKLDVFGTYLLGTERNQASRSYGLHLPGVRTVGFSPEILMKLTEDSSGGRVLVTHPVAGTRPRGHTPEMDKSLQRELFASAKEVQEHSLSIWSVQGEMQKVCLPNTVQVVDFMQVKQYRWVQHLCSKVQGRLADDRTLWDALAVLFPGVTVSGIEKDRAIAWIDRLEEEPRGIYAGAIGWINSSEEADLAIPIRSAYQYQDWIYLNAGAGIMGESIAANEYIESMNKMNTMLANLVLEA
ncbi:anthranilate synthase component I family protein [Roseofilum casamattae]|uniref:Anthranilate synthase component I family protein n=1 Tax=Roseofilum casamattae BLCC-M143 TaxID=3022442 RepID=A0ABT7BWT1_9CYAN|nr:anthranilate synthase component I family protein [Roseofilum casamattae]MDJ1183530.1 anthranilate synthase component I family protein [Roseofilum casamattae BLCC-M143]